MLKREILLESLKMNLKGLTLEQFRDLFITKTQAIEDFYKLQHDVKAGNTISLLFNPHRLNTSTITSDVSIYGSLQHENLLSGLARLYLYNLEHNISNSFYMAVQRGYNGVQYVNEFPPFVARRIYKTYSNSDGKLKILDPCCGWGGRMIGCASLENTTYIGYEPCTETYNGLLKLGEWLKTLNPTFEFKIYKLPFEDAELEDNFDIALTSPPYYDTENYSDEETNSKNRYSTFDDWCKNFYEPLILKTMKALKSEKSFILNVGARKYPLDDKLFEICKNNELYCERIEDYLSGNGEGKEKFYRISKVPFVTSKNYLF